MVEPVWLTLGAIAASLVAKAADKTADRAVEGGAGVRRGRLVGWLRDRFSKDEDEARATASRASPCRLLLGVVQIATASSAKPATNRRFGAASTPSSRGLLRWPNPEGRSTIAPIP
jgi:hypothetical protein